MKQTYGYLIGAILLIAIGTLLLLQTLNLITSEENWIWALAFAAGGVTMLGVFASSPVERWWAVIPGFVLIALGLLIAVGDRLGAWGAGLFLGGIGLAFWVVYLTNRDFWWALIPGGVLLTLTAVVGLSATVSDLQIGGIFFLGLAITFGLVFVLPTREGRQKWAIWPAGILLIMGVVISLASADILDWLWAVALIAGGLFLVLRAFITARRETPEKAEPLPPPTTEATSSPVGFPPVTDAGPLPTTSEQIPDEEGLEGDASEQEPSEQEGKPSGT